MTTEEKEQIYLHVIGRIPDGITDIVLCALKNSDDSYRYFLVCDGKFKEEIIMTLSKQQFEVLKDYFPVEDALMSYKSSAVHLNSVYRKIVLKQMELSL